VIQLDEETECYCKELRDSFRNPECWCVVVTDGTAFQSYDADSEVVVLDLLNSLAEANDDRTLTAMYWAPGPLVEAKVWPEKTGAVFRVTLSCSNTSSQGGTESKQVRNFVRADEAMRAYKDAIDSQSGDTVRVEYLPDGDADRAQLIREWEAALYQSTSERPFLDADNLPF
jgi:hypothetical protein